VVETRLNGWGPRGWVEAEINGRRALIDRGIPGEKVVVAAQRGRHPRRGIVTEVVNPSPDRITAPCPAYHRGCGGCQWQHMDYSAQLDTKRTLVDAAMERAGVGVRVGRVYAMRDPWRYRHTAAIAIGWEAGFRPRGRRGIVEVRDCPISHSLVGRLSASLNDALRAGHLPNYHGKVWLDCTVVGSESAPALQVLVQGISGLTLETHPELPDVARAISGMTGVESVAFRHRDGRPRPLVGDLDSIIEVAGRRMYVPNGAFFQTNLVLLPDLLDRLGQEAEGARIAADIYGGVGTLGLPLASRVASLTLIELDPDAVRAAAKTAEAWGLDNVRFISSHAERAMDEQPGLDLVIVDPPRSGLGESMAEALAARRVPRILYVSCAPPSLATDLAVFQEHGYRTRSLELFDFYPQTYHVEALAVVERADPGI